jgi:hypothetical protein
MLRRENLRKNAEILQDALEVMGAEWCLSKSTASELVDKMTGRHIGHYAHTWTVLVPFTQQMCYTLDHIQCNTHIYLDLNLTSYKFMSLKFFCRVCKRNSNAKPVRQHHFL